MPRYTTGADLRRERLQFGGRQEDVAQAMGVSQPRIARIEAAAIVTNAAVTRYRAALKGARALVARAHVEAAAAILVDLRR